MSQTLANLSIDEKRTVAAALLAERARRQASYPLSSAQLRLWLIDRQLGAEAVYNVSRAFLVEGSLDIAALERSVGEIVRRHSALRTTFHLTDGEPFQRISEPQAFVFAVRDLSDIPREERRREAERIAEHEARRGFRLDRDPMLRGLLVRLADSQHVLIFTFHHIAVDERSLEIFYDELRSCYESFSSGAVPALAQTRIQYVDFALWERAQNRSESVRGQLAYWKRRLAGVPLQTALPYARPRPDRPGYAGMLQRALVPRDRVAGLLEIARRVRATPFMTYLAAFAVLLHDVSAATDIVIGSPISGRRKLDTQNVIGFFANAVALRFDFSATPSFAEIVTQAKTATLEAFANGDVPFDRVVNAVGAPRSVTANPIFQVVFAMQTAGAEPPGLAGLTLAPLPQAQGDAKFDLLAHCIERDGALEIGFHYSTDLFDAPAIAEMLMRLGGAIERLVANPDVSIASLGFGRAALCGPQTQSTPALPRPETETNARPNAASDAVELRLREIWERLLGVRPTGNGDDFFALGGHSLSAVRLVAQIEEAFGVRLPLATLFREPTIERLARAIVSETAETAPGALAYVRHGTARRPLVIFHGDLNGVAAYVRAFADRLGDRTIVSIAPHGVDGGPIPPSVEAMAAERLDLLRRENIHPPYDLAGYCNGALIALEVGRQLAANAIPPPRIFAIGMEVYEPAIERVTNWVWRFGDLAHLTERARTQLVLRLLFRWNRLAAARGAASKATFVLRTIRSLGLRSASASASASASRVDAGGELSSLAPGERVPPLTGAYAERLIRYRPGCYDGRIVVFRPAPGPADARARGWARVSSSVTVVPILGDHITSVTVHAATLAERFREYLDR